MLDNGFELVSLYYAGLSPERLAVFENDERRNALNAVCLRCCLVFIHVYFDDRRGIAQIGLYFFKDRFHHFTRAAPFGRKIYQNRFIAVNQF